MSRSASIGIAITALALPLLVAPAQAQDTSAGCTREDPRIGQIVKINGNRPMQINRRKKKVNASVGDPICQYDITLPYNADVEIVFDQSKERVTIPKRTKRDFSGAKARSFTSGGKSADAEAAASLSPVQRAPLMRKVGMGDEDGIVPAGKPVIVVNLVDDPSGSGQAISFTMMIEAALSRTGKFEVMDRSRIADVTNEQQLSPSGKTTRIEGSSTDLYEGIDYLVSAKINSFSLNENKKNSLGNATAGLLLGGKGITGGCSDNWLRIDADFIVTDADDGRIARAESVWNETKAAKVCTDADQMDSAGLLRQSAEAIAASLATSIFPITVVDVQNDGTIVLNYGAGVLRPGDWLMLYGEGSEVSLPSGEGSIRIDGEKIGAVRVISVGEQTSLAAPTPPFADQVLVGAIGRPTAPPASGSSLIKAKKKKRE